MNNWGFCYLFNTTNMLKFKILFLFLFIFGGLQAQQSITGTIADSSSGKPIQGAEVYSADGRQGTISKSDGSFYLKLENNENEIQIRYLGYETLSLNLRDLASPVKIKLFKQTLELDEITILSDIARERHNPIAFSVIKGDKIAVGLGDRPLPEIMNFTPGVYAARSGGGSGDASLSIRGFQQENIAVLLNGIPINGAENGLVYWNNWMGLTEVASSIQMQRGIGASKVASNSVGGTVNIITLFPQNENSGSLTHQFTSYGNRKTTLSYNSGLMDNGWALTILGSRSTGDGYIDGTYVDGWAYFANLSKEINSFHRLVFTALGGPERHGQRNMMLTAAEVRQYGHHYNKEWGSYNGKINNASENFYHKPHLSATHYYAAGPKSVLATSVYYTPGKGGGKWNDSFNYGPGVFAFRNPSGQIDWDAIYQYNVSNSDFYLLANGDTARNYSKLVQTRFLASHIWTGAISTFETELNPGTKLSTGMHYRFFRSDLKQEVADLLGGKFYIDDFGWSLAGHAGRNQVKMPGDVIRIHNGALLHHTSVFAQLEQKAGNALIFSAINISDNRFRRHDIYNYPDNKWSKWVNKPGIDLKAGINYRINRYSHIYANAAHFNKAPYYKFVFGNFNNTPVLNIRNEKVNTVEAGFSRRDHHSYLGISAYYTLWKDVSFLSREYIQLENNQQTRAMVNGLNALHQGIEIEFSRKIYSDINLSLIAGYGNWKWTNNVEARLFNDRDVVVDTVRVYAKGLYVGGQPQFHAGIRLQAHVMKLLNFELEATHYDRHFASFDPSGRQNADNKQQSFRLPSFNIVNLTADYPITINDWDLKLFMNANNLFDSIYIVKGEDGPNHDFDGFRGFWSFGRTFDFGIKLRF